MLDCDSRLVFCVWIGAVSKRFRNISCCSTRTVRQDKGHSAERPDVGQRTSSVEPSCAGLSTGTSGGASGVQNGTSSAKPRRTDTDKPVPKWFKGTGWFDVLFNFNKAAFCHKLSYHSITLTFVSQCSHLSLLEA